MRQNIFQKQGKRREGIFSTLFSYHISETNNTVQNSLRKIKKSSKTEHECIQVQVKWNLISSKGNLHTICLTIY